MSYVPLQWLDLVLAGLLVLVNGLLSVVLRLGLERALAIAALRMVVQLGLLGVVLKLFLAQTSVYWVALAAVIMAGVAGHEVWARQSHRVRLWPTFALGTGTLLCVSVATSIYVMTLVVGLSPWYTPRFFIPILGMILGSALSGVALALDTLTQAATLERDGIEARLAQGHDKYTAFRAPLQRALSTAMSPMISAMAVSGVVALPGLMSGQILAGIDPLQAAKYQIAIMFAIAGATALSALVAALGGVRLLTDDRHRLRLDRLKAVTSA